MRVLVLVIAAMVCGRSAVRGRELQYVEVGAPVAAAAGAPAVVTLAPPVSTKPTDCFRPFPGGEDDSCFHFIQASSAQTCGSAAAAWDYNGNCFGKSTILYRFEDDGSRRWGTCALVLPLSCQMLLTNPPCRVGTAMCNGTLARYIDAYLAQPFYESGPAARVFARVPGPPTPPSPPSPPAITSSSGDDLIGPIDLPEVENEIIDNIG